MDTLKRAVRELVHNAVDSLGGGGRITLRVGQAELGPEELERLGELGKALVPGPFASVTVSDNGAGIPSDELGRVFDPYFSSQTPRRGIGLTRVLGTAVGHGGAVAIESEPLLIQPVAWPVSSSSWE